MDEDGAESDTLGAATPEQASQGPAKKRAKKAQSTAVVPAFGAYARNVVSGDDSDASGSAAAVKGKKKAKKGGANAGATALLPATVVAPTNRSSTRKRRAPIYLRG
jgi:hypothetical protein